MSDNHSKLSRELTKKIPKNEKKTQGIFFTPNETIKRNISVLEQYFDGFKNILEPSCGSCEYIEYILKHIKTHEIKTSITGIELNDTIYESIENMFIDETDVNIIKEDFITSDESKKYDLIIGNPPFFVMKKTSIDKDYQSYFDGRPNLFILFIIKSLKLLEVNGILSFILPKNFVNCLYYDKTRKYIAENYKILTIEECCGDYIDTKQETILFIIQNTKEPSDICNNSKYVVDISGYTIFGNENDIIQMNELLDNSSTLSSMGFAVNVGSVVWNQCKDILTNDETKTRLIYSSDIVDNKVIVKKYTNMYKKNYINRDGINDVMILVNRGYGMGDYNFNYCLLDVSFPYLIENHLICIKYIKQDTISKKELIEKYNKVIKSLQCERTKKFTKLYFGNNAINTTELNLIMPIYEI